MKSIVIKLINTDIYRIFKDTNKIYTFLNPVSYISARDNVKNYKLFDGYFADGFILTLFIKILYKKKVPRMSFDMTSIAPMLFHIAQQENKSIYIIGSTDNELNKAIDIIKSQYPSLNILGHQNGYFSSESDINEKINNLINLSPDFLIVGMGANIQEKFLSKVKENGYAGIGFTCGGFISQTAKGNLNKVNYYPKWIDTFNLRFVYRIYKEKHTRKRYLQAAFIFPYVFIKDWFNSN